MAWQLVVVGVIVVVAVAVASVIERRGRARRPAPTGAVVPPQIDRGDFARPDAPWLVLLFSSDACESCAAMAARLAPLASETTAVDEAEYRTRPDLHAKYAIAAVPVVGVYDADGVARATFVGPTPAETIWHAVADLRGA